MYKPEVDKKVTAMSINIIEQHLNMNIKCKEKDNVLDKKDAPYEKTFVK